MLARDMVIRVDNAMLEARKERFDRIRMGLSSDVFFRAMLHRQMRPYSVTMRS